MIVENQLKSLNNIIPKVNKKQPPKSINPDLTPFYFTAMFIGAKNSGKTYGLVKLIKNYEEQPIKDSDGNILPMRVILFCPTGNSEANPIYKTLKYLDDDDIVLSYTEEALLDKINEVQNIKEEIEERAEYLKTWKRFLKVGEDRIDLLTPDELLMLHKYDFINPVHLPPLKYKFPPITFFILDDLIGNNDVFKRNGLINNIVIKHRHLGINLIFTSQNPKSITNIIRNNIDIFVLYRFANVKMVLEKVFEEVSNLLTEEQFEELYKHATAEPHDALVIDTHPDTERDKRFRKNFNIVLTVQ